MLSQVPLEIVAPLRDPRLRLPPEPLALRSSRLADLANVLFSEALELLGFGRGALPDALDVGVEAVGGLRRDAVTLTVDGRLHAARDLVEERREPPARVTGGDSIPLVGSSVAAATVSGSIVLYCICPVPETARARRCYRAPDARRQHLDHKARCEEEPQRGYEKQSGRGERI